MQNGSDVRWIYLSASAATLVEREDADTHRGTSRACKVVMSFMLADNDNAVNIHLREEEGKILLAGSTIPGGMRFSPRGRLSSRRETSLCDAPRL